MSQNHHVYFTDGGCIHPTTPEARLASWAVVRDYADSYEHALAMTSIALQNKNPGPLLRPLDMGLVEGRQTISRGELCAVIMACENALQDRTMLKSDIFSDSQYVVNVIHFLEIGDLVRWGYRDYRSSDFTRLRVTWIGCRRKLRRLAVSRWGSTLLTESQHSP